MNETTPTSSGPVKPRRGEMRGVLPVPEVIPESALASGFEAAAALANRISPDEKRRLEEENRQLLEFDLWEGRHVFRSKPRVVELQLSNFCNMSCVMCYAGVNPPTMLLDPRVIRRLASELLPAASVLIPFATSEPLVLTWDLTRELALQYGVELELTTNVQYLDEKKFRELEPFVSVIAFSIDSHYRDVYEHIRINSRPDQVFENLPVAARLCREAGIQVTTNVVFMMENAAHVDRTVAFLADAGVPRIHVQKLFYNAPEMRLQDPTLHASPEFLAWTKAKLRRVAEEKKVLVSMDFDHHEVVDRLPKEEKFRPSRSYDGWLERVRRTYPGYCPQSVYRFKVDVSGNAFPCCVGTGDQLKLGNIYESGFDDIWNSLTAQDLRRGMLTDDLPTLCVECNFRTGPIPAELPQLPFGDVHYQPIECFPEQWTLQAESPAHLERCTTPPEFRWSKAHYPVDRYELVLSLGGDRPDRVYRVPGHENFFQMSEADFQSCGLFAAYWWNVYAVVESDPGKYLRLQNIRCFRRHEDRPRVIGSTLDYGQLV